MGTGTPVGPRSEPLGMTMSGGGAASGTVLALPPAPPPWFPALPASTSRAGEPDSAELQETSGTTVSKRQRGQSRLMRADLNTRPHPESASASVEPATKRGEPLLQRV